MKLGHAVQPDTCAAKRRWTKERGLILCGEPVEYREHGDSDDWWVISGWYHVTPGPTHHAVPSRYVR